MFIFMRYKNTNSKLQLSFKKRYKIHNNYYFTNTLNNFSVLMACKPILFYFIYFKLLRKSLKNLYSKSYMLQKKISIYVPIMTNFPISTKSKNARMGKGKGSLVSWSCRLPLGFYIVYFNNINKNNLKKVDKNFKKIILNNTTLIFKNNQNLLSF